MATAMPSSHITIFICCQPIPPRDKTIKEIFNGVHGSVNGFTDKTCIYFN